MLIITIILTSYTAREHVIRKSKIWNILSCKRVFIAVENWMARCSRTSGLISFQKLETLFSRMEVRKQTRRFPLGSERTKGESTATFYSLQSDSWSEINSSS